MINNAKKPYETVANTDFKCKQNCIFRSYIMFLHSALHKFIDLGGCLESTALKEMIIKLQLYPLVWLPCPSFSLIFDKLCIVKVWYIRLYAYMQKEPSPIWQTVYIIWIWIKSKIKWALLYNRLFCFSDTFLTLKQLTN